VGWGRVLRVQAVRLRCDEGGRAGRGGMRWQVARRLTSRTKVSVLEKQWVLLGSTWCVSEGEAVLDDHSRDSRVLALMDAIEWADSNASEQNS